MSESTNQDHFILFGNKKTTVYTWPQYTHKGIGVGIGETITASPIPKRNTQQQHQKPVISTYVPEGHQGRLNLKPLESRVK